jgi:hypothetical protein
MINKVRGLTFIQVLIILLFVGLFIKVGIDIYLNKMNNNDGTLINLQIPNQRDFIK